MAGLQAYKLWKSIFTSKHLKQVFDEKIKYKTAVGIDWVTSERFENLIDEEVSIILRKSSDLTYRFTKYKELLITKGPNKFPRRLSIPTMRDKLTLAVLNEIIVGTYGKEIMPQMPQMVIDHLSKALQSGKYDAYIKTDIVSFYKSIDRELLLSFIKRRIHKKQILHLIESAICTETVAANVTGSPGVSEYGIPEGLAISNALAAIYLHSLDAYFGRYPDGIFYNRYVDDIIILTSSKAVENVQKDLIEQTKRLHIRLHDDSGKTQIGRLPDSFDYLGYRFSGEKITVRHSSVIAFEHSIDKLFRDWKHSSNQNTDYLEWKINLKITGFIINGHKYGWIFFYSQINDESLLVHLDWYVNVLKKRYAVGDLVKTKRFVRSFYEIKKALHNTNYIPNFDKYTLDQKKKIIEMVYGLSAKLMSSSQIERKFDSLISREMKDIQKDVQPFS